MNNETSSSPLRDRPLLHGVDWAVRAGVMEEVMRGSRQRARQRKQRRFALATGVAVIALMTAVWTARLSPPIASGPAAPASIVVAVPARQTLPDGTLVELREGAQISVEYSREARRVALRRGEAHFQVIKDAARPFIVVVDALEVRAVGTAFAVNRQSSHVEVLVTHGTVAVNRVAEPGAATAPTIAMLEAGHHTRVDVADVKEVPVVEALAPVDLDRRLAWRAPRLEFTGTPLAEAIPMINERSAVKLSLADPALGTVRISGLLRADNVESLFRLLEVEHGIRAEQKSAREIVLHAGR